MVSSSDYELDFICLPQSWGSQRFNILDPFKVSCHSQGQQFTLFTIHDSWGSTHGGFSVRLLLGKITNIAIKSQLLWIPKTGCL